MKLVSQWQNFDLANADFAAGIMLLERKVSVFKCLAEIQVFVEYFAIDVELDACHFTATPDVITTFNFVSEPGVWFDKFMINVAHAVQRARANWIGVSAVDLCLMAVGEAWLSCCAEVQTGIPVIVDLHFSAVAEVFVRTFGADQHGSRARAVD